MAYLTSIKKFIQNSVHLQPTLTLGESKVMTATSLTIFVLVCFGVVEYNLHFDDPKK